MAPRCLALPMAVVVVCALAAPALAEAPPRNGSYTAADFVLPDFVDGDVATLAIGSSATFTYTCACGGVRKDPDCSGSARIEVDDGSGFMGVDSTPCDAAKDSGCTASTVWPAESAGVYSFRIVCDEQDGTDYVQDPSEYVTIAAEDLKPCTDGETRACPQQVGVCAGSFETCVGGAWPGCDYGPDYQTQEASCDSLDNDCDGVVDDVDLDGDGYTACATAPGVVNELVLTNIGQQGALAVYEYRFGQYVEVWSSLNPDVETTIGGGEMGDLTGDGIPEFALVRAGDVEPYRLEIWALDPAGAGWTLLTSVSCGLYPPLLVGDIADVDGDGSNELLITYGGGKALEVYSYDGSGLVLEASVQDCSAEDALFIGTVGDLDGDGTPEIVFQCDSPEDILVHEYLAGSYRLVGRVPVPISGYGSPMIVDDMETGDVNRDGRDDAVFCGNSGAVHVLTYRGGAYVVEFSSPPPAQIDAHSQTCSVGDVTNDGFDDILVVNKEGARVYSHDGTGYQLVWIGSRPTGTPPIGASCVGDPDNDGFDELLFSDVGLDQPSMNVKLYESDLVGAGDFQLTHTFEPAVYGGGTILVGDLDPTNDLPQLDCDDADPTQGMAELCGDGLDNDCDGVAEEGCPTEFCGDGFCSGEGAGESCITCPADCACQGPGCKLGCCGDSVCDRKEDAASCPVDCG